MEDALSANIAEAVEEEFPAAVEMLQELVRVPSVTGSEGAAQKLVERLFMSRQLQVDRWISTDEEIAPYIWHVGEQELADRPNVAGVLPGAGEGASLLLNAHIDTVDNGDPKLWSVNPNSGAVVEGRLYGRGACDMKGGLVTHLAAIDVLRRIGIRLAGDVTVVSTVGEEDGGVGSLLTVLRGYKADAAIITEPTGLRIVAAHAGSLVMRMTITGRSAHGGARNEGVSAVEKFIPIFEDLLVWEQERNQSLDHPMFLHLENKIPISFGVVRAGTWASTVPEKLVAEARIGFLPGEDPAEFTQAVIDRIMTKANEDAWLREHPPEIEWFGGQFAPSETSSDAPITRALQTAHQAVTGNLPPIEGAPYGADMRIYSVLGGMPCLMYGAGNVRVAHQNDEYMELDELKIAIGTMTHLLVNWCGVAS